MPQQANILFFTHPYPNYVPDLLLHGLRKLLGPQVVDYPRKNCLYEGVLGLGVCPPDQLCPNWFPQDNGSVDREDIWHKIQHGFFNLIVCDARAVPALLEKLSDWPAGLVIIDGEDFPAKIRPGKYVVCRRETDGCDFSIPLPMAIPEEILQWISSYDEAPKQHSIGFLGSTHDGVRKQIADTIRQYYPDALLQTSIVPSGDNPSPDGRLGRDEYYRSVQKCRILLSLPGAGYDTFRFWENAACNAIHVSSRMPLFVPNDFIDYSHIFRFEKIEELRRIMDEILQGRVHSEEVISNNRYHLVTHHLTTKRAEYFLNKIKRAFAD
jgi:hypothetical protein